jgi:uncharacterized membrane protein YheB (UPF0754 family)
MDTSSYVYIALAAATGVGTVVWFWIKRVQMSLEAHAQALNGKAGHDDVESLKDELHATQMAMNTQFKDFQLECQKNFVSNTALMQVMSSLDRTIQQLTQAIQHNAQESREGIKAINDRIDTLMHNRGP